MKIVQILGHNPNWNVEDFTQQNIGDEFLITAISFGNKFAINKRVAPILDKSMLDLQFYGQKNSGHLSKGKLSDFDFHPARFLNDDEATNIRINSCIEKAIEYQISLGFKKIIIPHYYEDNYIAGIISTIKVINKYLKSNKKDGIEYFMTLQLAYDIIRNQDNVENLLLELTDMSIIFDGYFVVCENKPEQGHKISNDIKLITNLSKVLRVLKYQGFKTIYGYANWDAIFFLAQTDIDYITGGLDEYPVTGKAAADYLKENPVDLYVVCGVPHAFPVEEIEGESIAVTDGPRLVEPLKDLGYDNVVAELDAHSKTLGTDKIVFSDFGGMIRSAIDWK